MKKLLPLICFLAALSAYGQSYNFLGTFQTDGTPDYLEPIDDIVTPEFLEFVNLALPENFPVPDFNPQYITSGYDTDILLDEDADVWVTFVGEGAGYKNILGFYTYEIINPLSAAPSREDITIVFPNVSKLFSGGGLVPGNKVHLGRFPAGTGIGWVLLANGYQNNEVTDGLWRVFSNSDFNPENDPYLQQHNVLLKDPDSERIILGFEDIRRDYASCDQDFNDALFYITANPYSAIRTTNISDPDIVERSVTSGNTGGLESNGDLATLVSRRKLKRLKKQDPNGLKTLQKSMLMKRGSNPQGLDRYMPSTGKFGTEEPRYSTPSDLIGVTNAQEVVSVDYYSEEDRVAAILATATDDGVYDHSKVICDRLNGSSLEEVRSVRVRGHQVISSKIKRENNVMEYTVSFSVKLGDQENELFSYWNIGQYPAGDYNNFQIWGNSFSQVFNLANHIIDTLNTEKALISTSNNEILPDVYVQSGFYDQGKLYLNIVNRVGAQQTYFTGNVKTTEVASLSTYNTTIPLNGDVYQQVVVDTGSLFDIGFSLATNTTPAIDALYLADGPWGLDYLENEVMIDQFDIELSQNEVNADGYQVERNPKISGSIRETMNLFRHLKAGELMVDVTELEQISFEYKSSLPMEVILVTDLDIPWENRLRKTIPAATAMTQQHIPFSEFLDSSGNPVNFDNLRSVVFSINGDYSSFKPFELQLNDVSLEKASKIEEVATTQKLQNYPNPFTDHTKISLTQSTESVQLRVFDLSGRMILSQDVDTAQGEREVSFTPQDMRPGIYTYTITYDDSKTEASKFVKK